MIALPKNARRLPFRTIMMELMGSAQILTFIKKSIKNSNAYRRLAAILTTAEARKVLRITLIDTLITR